MGDLKIGQNGKTLRDVVPGIALEADIVLIEAGVLIVDRRLRIELEIDAVPFPKRMRAQRWFDHRSDVRTLHGVRGKDIAVIEGAESQRGAVHPRSGTDADRLVSWLLSILHRHVLRRYFFAAIRIRQVRLRRWLEYPLCVPWWCDFLTGR